VKQKKYILLKRRTGRRRIGTRDKTHNNLAGDKTKTEVKGMNQSGGAGAGEGNEPIRRG